MRFEKIQLINLLNKVVFKWEYESVFEDFDGILIGKSVVLIMKGKFKFCNVDKIFY